MRQAVVDLASQPIRNVHYNPIVTSNTAGWGHFGASAQARVTGVVGPYGATVNVYRTTYDNSTVGGPYFTARALGSEMHGPYVASAWVKSSVAHSVAVKAERYPGVSGGTTTPTYSGTTWSLPANTWTRVWAAVPAAPGFPYITITLYSASGSVPLGAVIETTMVSIVPGTTLLPYCDGNTPGWRWTGTTGASVSAGYPYTLESIAGRPTLWWSASDLALADFANVTAWTDRIAGATVTPPGTPPVFRTAQMGGRPAVSFSNGVERKLQATITTAAQPITTFTATDPDVSGANRNVFIHGAEIIYGPSQVIAYAGTSVTWLGTTSNAPVVLAGKFDGASSALYSDGVARATGNAGTRGLQNTLTLGGHNAATDRGYGGSIAEHIVYPRALDAQTIARVTAWLARMYGTPIPTGY